MKRQALAAIIASMFALAACGATKLHKPLPKAPAASAEAVKLRYTSCRRNSGR